MVALSFVPPAIAGYRLERQIERRLGGPRAIAAGLLAGAAGDGRGRHAASGARAGRRRPGGRARARASLRPRRWYLGVSRNGATLTAARFRRFTREHANLLSRTVALPVIVGATALKGVRLRRRGVGRSSRRAIAAGVGDLVRLDPGLPAAHRARRARPRAVAVRGLPPRRLATADRRRECGDVSDRDAYARGGRQPARRGPRRRRRSSGTCSWIDTGKPSRDRRPARPLRQRPRGSDDELGIAIATDGVGTKMIVAERLGRFDTIGIDCVAMNVNDLDLRRRRAGRDARLHPLRAGRPRGLRRDRRRAAPRAPSWPGSRSPAERSPRSARSCNGLGARATRDRDRRPSTRSSPAQPIEPGDAVIGLPSSGLHSNGYTLARRCSPTRSRLEDRPPRAAARRRPARADRDLRARGARAAAAPRSTCAASPTSRATGCATCPARRPGRVRDRRPAPRAPDLRPDSRARRGRRRRDARGLQHGLRVLLRGPRAATRRQRWSFSRSAIPARGRIGDASPTRAGLVER